MAPATEVRGEVIGIDLGTTFSCVAVACDGKAEIIVNDQGNRTTPSFVAFSAADSERLIGEAAKNQAALNPRQTVFDVKRLIGKMFDDAEVQRDLKYLPYPVANRGGKPYVEMQVKAGGEVKQGFSPEEISAMILGKMKETAEDYLGKPVSGAVVTVPAYFNDMQRQATKDAGRIAGLNVLRMINEPTAAAIAYGLNNLNLKRKQTKSKILVYDLGGGTFDVSVLELDGRVFRVLATGGDAHLGGGGFDQRVMDYFIKLIKSKYNKVDVGEDSRALAKLRKECERAKRVLSNQSQVRVEIDALFQGMDFSEPLTRAKFEELNLDLFNRTLDVVKMTLEDAELEKSDIEEIVLVGGSTRIPRLREMLKDMFDGKEPSKSVNPDEAVAYGAAILGASLGGQTAKYGVTLFDVTPLSLGLKVHGGLMNVVIPRNTGIPTKMSRVFVTSLDQQTSLPIKVYQGERPLVKDCIELGSFNLDGITPGPRGAAEVDTTFEIDEDGILKVTATENTSTRSKSLTITTYGGNLKEADIKRMIRDAQKMANADKMAKARVEAWNKLERYIYDVKKTINDEDKLVSGSSVQLSLSDMNQVMKIALGEASRWLDDHQHASLEDCEKKLKEVTDVWTPIITRVCGINVVNK